MLKPIHEQIKKDMMNYAWAIKNQAVSNGPFTIEQIYDHPLKEPFRLLDDDGEIYYEGFFVSLSDDATGFEPLDDFGRPDSGCTSIQYRENGQWKTL